MSFIYKHCSTFSKPYYCLFLFHCFLITVTRAQAQNSFGKKASNNSIPAIFVFGDSTVDPGNNNKLKTVFRSNFRPYGKDFPNQVPTGRFTNGKLTTDFIAGYAGIKDYVPPYQDQKLTNEELITGVSFASAGSGYDPLTPQISNVIPMSEQMEQFKEYQKRVELLIGKESTQNLVKNALYFVSAGTNDYVVNYFTIPIRRNNYTVPSYKEFLIQQVQHFLQDLLDQGAKRIGVVGLPPIGCLPVVITSNSKNPFLGRSCVDYFSSIANDHNQMLTSKLNDIQNSVPNSALRIAYLDIYSPLLDMITESHTYNFEEVNTGCCGTGLVEATFLCNPASYVCSDASKYIFFDSIHPSEKTYNLVFEALKPKIDYLITA